MLTCAFAHLIAELSNYVAARFISACPENVSSDKAVISITAGALPKRSADSASGLLWLSGNSGAISRSATPPIPHSNASSNSAASADWVSLCSRRLRRSVAFVSVKRSPRSLSIVCKRRRAKIGMFQKRFDSDLRFYSEAPGGAEFCWVARITKGPRALFGLLSRIRFQASGDLLTGNVFDIGEAKCVRGKPSRDIENDLIAELEVSYRFMFIMDSDSSQTRWR